MEVHLNPDLARQLADLAAQAGRPANDLAQDAIAGYLSEITAARGLLDGRYDDIKSGKVKLIPGEEIEAYFREKAASARAKSDV